jgi:hypothetical protein
MALRISIDSDTWWHLRAGAEIVERRAVITEDPFSITRYQESWRYPGWLAQLVLFEAYQGMGFAGLNIITALMVTIAFMWIWRFIEGPLVLRSALIILAATASGVYWSARPQIMTFALSGVFIHLLEREQGGEKIPLWIYLSVMALWGNLHGGFVIGFLLIGAYLGGQLLQIIGGAIRDAVSWRKFFELNRLLLLRFVWIVVVSLLGLSLNSHGPSLLLYPFKTVSIGVLREYIQEWQSPDFHMLGVQPFLWMIVLAFGGFGLKKGQTRPTDYLLVLGFMLMSFWAARNIAVFALGAVVPISRALASIPIKVNWKGSSKQVAPSVQKYLNVFLAITFLIAAMIKVSLPLNNGYNQKKLDEIFPSAAMTHLAEHVASGPIFNSYNWGAYLIWELYPEYRSFVDGRTDLFNDEILEDYLAAWRGEAAWKDIFNQWEIEIALIEPSSPIASKLQAEGWQLEFEDSKSVIFTKPGDS